MSEIAGQTESCGILLLAHGTPDSLDQIPEYLSNITGGRPMSEAAVEEIRRRYSLIGSSPLTQLTLEQGRLLEKELHLPVYVGMRNWRPYIAEAVRQMRADGITSAVTICLAPQNSRTSVGLYRRATLAESAGSIEMVFIDSWADHPKLAQAFAERLEPVWRCAVQKAGRSAAVLFTAHSVPCRTVQSETQTQSGDAASAARISPAMEPDPYPVEAKRTAANVAALLASAGLTGKDWFFAFQSQGMSGQSKSGNSGSDNSGSGNSSFVQSWIGPTVEDTLTALRQEGRSLVVIQPIGFLCDHVEILYDIDIGFRQLAAKIGLEIARPPSLNDSPLLIDALADLARQGLARLDLARPSLGLRDIRAEVVSVSSR